MGSVIRKVLGVGLRLHRLTHSLGLANAAKVALVARAGSGETALSLPPYPHSFRIRCRTTDDTVVEQVFGNREYPILPGFHPKRIIDAGANCGASTAFFGGHYPDAAIVALEPEESNFRLLERNLAPLGTVKLLQGALWPTPGYVSILDGAEQKYAVRVRGGMRQGRGW